MESKLKAVRRGHRGQVTKLFKKFDEIENNSDLDKDDVKLISDAIEQKQRTIVDLNEKILDLTSEKDVAEEIQESDEYMFNLESKLRKIRKIYSDSISQNVASTSLDPNANSFMPSYPTNSSLTNANVIRSNETEINVQPTNFDNFRSMQNTHRDLQSTNNLYNQGFSSVSNSKESEIEKFWNLESLGIRLPQQDDEESFVKTYQQDCIKFENERYSAKLPWKLDHPDRPILYPLEIRTNINNLDDKNDDTSTERLTRVLPKRETSVQARLPKSDRLR
ncbi:unnamed protein product [Mytilus edulis]|uniref:Uncharacterized protein n=1 Tax=Mytilus edulis TaxID=6550 RepID=A0A8S3Q3P5_MYTED|nr:unnamed protein product [Mytilus edulis]